MKINTSKDMSSSFNKMSDEKIEKILKNRSDGKYKKWFIISLILSILIWPVGPILVLAFYFIGFAILKGHYEHRQFMQKYAKSNNFLINRLPI